MKRRQRRIADPTAESVYSAEFLELLEEMVDYMPVWEGQALRQHLGLSVSTPVLERLASYSDEERKLLVSRGMSRLLHPARVLNVARLIDADTLNQTIGWKRADYVVRCDRHQVDVILGGCARCPCPTGVDRSGRTREYCSNACRQAAYRTRRKEAC